MKLKLPFRYFTKKLLLEFKNKDKEHQLVLCIESLLSIAYQLDRWEDFEILHRLSRALHHSIMTKNGWGGE